MGLHINWKRSFQKTFFSIYGKHSNYHYENLANLMANLSINYPSLTKRQGEAPGLKPSININRAFCFNWKRFWFISCYTTRLRRALFFLPALHSAVCTITGKKLLNIYIIVHHMLNFLSQYQHIEKMVFLVRSKIVNFYRNIQIV